MGRHYVFNAGERACRVLQEVDHAKVQLLFKRFMLDPQQSRVMIILPLSEQQQRTAAPTAKMLQVSAELALNVTYVVDTANHRQVAEWKQLQDW